MVEHNTDTPVDERQSSVIYSSKQERLPGRATQAIAPGG